MSLALVKLGGSVITDKARYRSFNQESTDRLAREIASSGKQVILVHGAGSFGHLLAHEHQLQRGYLRDSQRIGVAKVQQDVRDLNREVMLSLDRAGIPATSIPPGACALMEGALLKKDGPRAFPTLSGPGNHPGDPISMIVNENSGVDEALTFLQAR